MYTVEKEISETTIETYSFNVFNNEKIVLVGYTLKEKPKGKRKYYIINKWDRYMKSNSNVNEPLLNTEIKNLILTKIISHLQILQSTEYFK